MYLLWGIFQSRYIESPRPQRPGLFFTSADGGNGEGAGVHQISLVAMVLSRITGNGFLVEGKAGGSFIGFHILLGLNFSY